MKITRTVCIIALLLFGAPIFLHLQEPEICHGDTARGRVPKHPSKSPIRDFPFQIPWHVPKIPVLTSAAVVAIA